MLKLDRIGQGQSPKVRVLAAKRSLTRVRSRELLVILISSLALISHSSFPAKFIFGPTSKIYPESDHFSPLSATSWNQATITCPLTFAILSCFRPLLSFILFSTPQPGQRASLLWARPRVAPICLSVKAHILILTRQPFGTWSPSPP